LLQAEATKPARTRRNTTAAGESAADAAPAPTAEDSAPPPAAPEAPVITLEAVRARLASLSQSGHRDEVNALITGTGFKRLTDIPADRYGEILEAAKQIA
jgi:hypothetical protein